MTPPDPDPRDTLPLDAADRVDRACDRFEAAWGRGERPRIEDALGDTSDPERSALLLALLATEFEIRRRLGERPDAGDYRLRFPGRDALIDSLAADGPTSPAPDPAATTDPEATATAHPTPGGPGDSSRRDRDEGSAPGPHQNGRFRILRPHARGNLGEVFVARDEELHREVALKQIQAYHAHRADSRSRFVMEAEITGGLEHPGIVPVYGLGQDGEGRPYYAMRFIRGETLKAAIAAFHAAEGPARDPAERTRALRHLLLRFIDVCDAVAYAHGRGILHRDIKPDNIMLGPYGETLVVDWGLAKAIGRSSDSARPAEGTLHPTADATPEPTRAGSINGTPAFMSPEQARGDAAELGPPSDVYGIGATLYVLLTGRTAFSDRDKYALLAKVRAGDFPPPRSINPRVPAALEAICLKAMSLSAESRYRTAVDLARDLDLWLADEPVSAFPEPWAARASRWVRRHRPAVASAAALLVASTIGLVIDDFRVKAQKARIEQARTEAVALRDRATSSFAVARDAVDQMAREALDLRGLVISTTEDRLRRDLAGKALASYERLLALAPADPSLRAQVAKAAREAANLGRLIGKYEGPLAAYRRAEGLLRGLVAESPAVSSHRSTLALTGIDLGELHRMAGRLPPAEAAFRRALVDLGPPPGDAGHLVEHRLVEGIAHWNLCGALVELGRHDEARTSGLRAVTLLTPAAAPSRQDTLLLSLAQASLGVAQRGAGDPASAELSLAAAVAGARSLVDANKVDRDAQFALASALDEQGALFTAGTRHVPAGRAHAEAARIMGDLTRRYPQIHFYRRELAIALDGRGAALLAANQLDDARRDCQQARGLLEGMLAAEDQPETRVRLARSLSNLSRIAESAGDFDDAAALLDDAIARHGAASPEGPAGRKARGPLDDYLARRDALVRKRRGP